MATEAAREAKEGIALGIVAGVILGLVWVGAAAATGHPGTPLRLFASVVLGRMAMETLPIGYAAVVGIVVHLILSALFGLLFVFIDVRLRDDVQRLWTGQAVVGAGFGALLWFINLQVIARVLYPWFLEGVEAQFLQFMMHALFFGLPLGLLYARTERRLHPLEESPVGV
jgi:hypothetical protein